MLKNLKDYLFYIITIGGFSVLIYFLIVLGKQQEVGKLIDDVRPVLSNWQQFKETYFHNLTHPLAILLVQIITIIVIARVFGYICRKIKQPTVVGEVMAGIFLGPSFVGHFFPELSLALFPVNSLSNLQFLSQIGLILFMFVVGMELDMKMLKNKARDAVIISHASIIFPFALGVTLAYFIYKSYAPQNVNFLSFSLFIGISMSITAFPVLARIVQEKGLTKTRLGNIVITCAAADDVTAWCLLAAVIAIVKAGSFVSSIYTIILAAAYVAIMLKLVRPFLKNLGDKYANKEGLSKPVVGIFFIVLLMSAYCSEVIGIHALFGAFLAGVIMPSNVRFRNIFIEKVEDVALVLLLPLFFVFTGLRTEIGLLNDPGLWLTCLLIIAVAVAGKFFGSSLAARFVGQSWKDSLTIGALMNTRGLMELVVLNIGYDLGVLSPEIFAMMVLMAVITTLMTAPALNLINRIFYEKFPTLVSGKIGKVSKYSVLVSFGSPQKGVSLLRLANAMVARSSELSDVTAMHLSPSNEINQYNFAEYESESFKPIKSEAKKLDRKVNLFFKPSNDIEAEIIQTANESNFDLLLIGVGKSIFSGTLLGRIVNYTSRIISPTVLYNSILGKESLFDEGVLDEKVKNILRSSKIPVGILIDKKLEKVDRVFISLFSADDLFLLNYAKKFIQHNDSKATLLDARNLLANDVTAQQAISLLKENFTTQVTMLNAAGAGKNVLNEQDLIVLSVDGLKQVIETAPYWLSLKPSILIIKK